MKHILRKSLLLLSIAGLALAGCDKSAAELEELRSELGSLSDRVVALENTQIKTLEERIASIEKEITSLQGADKVLSEDISALEVKMSVVSEDLATIKESVSSLNGTSDELSGKISAINAKLSELEDQISSILTSIAELKTKVDAKSSVTLSYIPKYADNNEPVQYTRDTLKIIGTTTLNFIVQPSSAAETIAKDWKSTLSTIAVYTLTKANGGESVALAVSDASAKEGVLSVTVAVDMLGKDFILGDIGAALAVKVSCGDIQIVTDHINLFPVMKEKNFISYLLNNFDTDGDGQVNDMDKVTSFSIGNSFERPDLAATTIDDILSQMPALEYLYCGSCGLTSLNLSKNHALTSLNCSSNQLTSLDLSKNPELTSLDCRSNKLTSLDLSNKPKLASLNIDNNGKNLTSLVVVNTALKTLDCSGWGLTSLTIADNDALTTLNCSKNNLTSIDLSQNEKLTSVNLTGNSKLTRVVCKSLDWALGCSKLLSDGSALYYLSDGTQIALDTSLSTVIDGKTWKQYNVGARLGNIYGDHYTFDNAQTACPSGWRVPTKDELSSLSANYSDWTTNGVNGRWFSGSQAYSSSVSAIFLPVDSTNPDYGLYWSSTEYNSSLAYRLTFQSYENLGVYYNSYRSSESSVRCLKD